MAVYLYAPADGPDADECWSDLSNLWHTLSSPESKLPARIEGIHGDREFVARAGSSHGSVRQMALWRRHDVLCMGVLLAPREGHADISGKTDWAALEQTWNELCPDVSLPRLLGQSRVLMALRQAGWRSGALLTRAVRQAVPSAAPPGWWTRGEVVPPGFELWEASLSRDDGRALRRMVVTCVPRHQAALNRWTWRAPGSRLPTLAGYMLHLVKVRYQYRVHAREIRFRDTSDALEEQIADLVALHDADRPMSPQQWRQAHRDLERVRVTAMDLALTAAGLAEMARTLRIAQANARALLPLPAASPVGGPLADDQQMIEWFGAQLEDDQFYVEAAVQRATGMETITEARIAQWFHDREEEARLRSDRLIVLQTSILGTLLMGLGAIQAFQYRLPMPGRLYAPLIAVLSALALTLPTVIVRLSGSSPGAHGIGLVGYAGTTGAGAALGWLAASLGSYVRGQPVPEPLGTILSAGIGAVLVTAAAAARSWFVRRRDRSNRTA